MTALTSIPDTTSAAADTSVLPTPFNETDIGHVGGARGKFDKNEPCRVSYIFIPYTTKVRRYPYPQTPAPCRQRACQENLTAYGESLLEKKYVAIWKQLNLTRPDRGKKMYAWVDPKKDTLYLDTKLDIRGDVEDFKIEFDSVVLSQIGSSPLKLDTLLQWIISLCYWEEGRPVSPGPKEIRLVQKSYELETIAGRVNSENDLLLVDLDKSHDISWMSRLAPGLDGEIAEQRNKAYVLSGYDDIDVKVEQTAVGEHVLHFGSVDVGSVDGESLSIILPPAATVEYYSDADWDLSCWDISLSCWDTLSVLLSEIGQKYLEYLGFEGQTPTFRRLVQFRSTENDEKITDEDDATIDSSLDSD